MIQALVLLVVLAFLTGFLAVVWWLSWSQAGRIVREGSRAGPRWSLMGRPQVVVCVSTRLSPAKHDHRLTGSGLIDKELQQALQLALRDFVCSWFHVWVSADSEFPDNVQQTAQLVVQEVADRCKRADLISLLNQRVPEECLNHMTRYKEASESAESSSIESYVFDNLPSNDPWGVVCCQAEAQQAYFQALSEILLYLVLPKEVFQNPVLRNLLRDVLTQQVFLPLLQVLSSPDFINTTLISLCKDSTLNSETFMAAVRSCKHHSELEQVEAAAAREVEGLKKRGVSDCDKQKLACLEVVTATIKNQLDGQPEEVLEDSEAFLPLSFSVSIPEYVLQPSKHVAYVVRVQCQHLGVGVREEWTTLRRFSDFHDLHITLRTVLGSLPPSLSLPSKRALKKLEPAFLEVRRAGLEQYLQTLVSEAVLSRCQPALPHLLMFLSDGAYRRSSNELDRQVDRFVHPFKRQSMYSIKSETATKMDVPSPPTLKRQRTLTENRESSFEEEEELDLPLAVLVELFDLRKQGQWLRRRLAYLLSQLIGGRVSRKIAEVVEWLGSPEQVAEYCRDLTNIVWPGGYRPTPVTTRSSGEEGEGEGEGEGDREGGEGAEAVRCLLARAKLIGSIPDELRTLLGTSPTTHGMARLSHLLQEPALNRWLVLRLLEAAMDTLFPSHGLPHTLRSLRCQLSPARAQ